MTSTILVVDDEEHYLRLMEFNLSTEGYQVIKAKNGVEAIDIVAQQKPDLVLLDIRMPVLDGFRTCERIRSFSNIPIIIVTAIGHEKDRIRGLDLGADDYIIKPFSINELLARVRSVLRRNQFNGIAYSNRIFINGNLKIDYSRAEVFRDDQPIYLSATEYRLLLQFARNVGNVLSSEQLLSDVWGPEYKHDKEIFWVSISRLRQKLEIDPKNPEHIVTRPGFGYTMPLLE
ncbi:MAG: response regulator transcription factor [Anaerolineales bacterium]|jgi:DNA-binding response OmpR family regulator